MDAFHARYAAGAYHGGQPHGPLVNSEGVPVRALRDLGVDKQSVHDDIHFGSETTTVGGREVPVLEGHGQTAYTAQTATQRDIAERALRHATLPHLQADIGEQQLHIFIDCPRGRAARR